MPLWSKPIASDHGEFKVKGKSRFSGGDYCSGCGGKIRGKSFPLDGKLRCEDCHILDVQLALARTSYAKVDNTATKRNQSLKRGTQQRGSRWS